MNTNILLVIIMVFGLFKKSKKKSLNDFLDENKGKILKINLNKPLDCICDFTYNFVWQSSFDYNQKVVDGISFKDLVEHLKNRGIIYIKGNVGHRFCSSMGADLKYFGGTGGKIDVGTVIVDGDIDTRFGISMVSGTVYVNEGNKIKEPIGNIVEVESDIKGYKKFISITEYIEGRHKNEKLLKPNKFDKNYNLILNDRIVRDTVGARLNVDATITINGNVDLSTGILMKKGTIIVNGNAGKFLGAKKKGGVIYAKDGAPVPPTKKYSLDKKDKEYLEHRLLSGYESLMDINVDFISELGTTSLTIRELLKLEKGSVIDLEKPAGESVELFVNNKIFRKGEVMVYEKNLAIRINEILDSKTVIQYFKKEVG